MDHINEIYHAAVDIIQECNHHCFMVDDSMVLTIGK